eukprot:CAMPEP_0116131382 /NCGR_PEP_ID=MMETSP0329-20121206/8975_1 /TAXON_ID=697910 /ORGANISM="Pseudo-nitzschia arenysensis, Strain B593" /LENGTH=571 /DNA_ID=CAMNT_0003625807 /DNA_START=602 /DNA_END=2317 /DNA_ORIENTATION=-
MLPPENSATVRERSSSLNITIEKEQPQHIRTHAHRLKIPKTLAKQFSHRSSAYTTGESTCESSGVSMNCSEEFISEIEKSDDFRSGQMTSTTCEPQSSSLQPSSASEASAMSTCDESEAIYYFGYGPIVNPIVRYRRGCMIPPEQIKTAILYDHRLKFVAGGTANVVATRGWDVKGVLLRFNSQEEWQNFKQYDANYDVREISVSVIDKTNLDPKNKNDHTAPFEERGDDQQELGLDESDRSGPLVRSRMHKSMLVSGGSSSLNSLEDNSESDEEEYSCPFSFEPKSKKADPNAVKCYTFVINQPNGQPRHTISENAPYRGTNGGSASVIGKPQERYLKLMTDGLRAHEIDETYIHDEVLSVNYIPNERDKVTDQNNYKSFLEAKKIAKVNFQKYETKLCKAKDNATHFVIGNKIMRVEGSIYNSLDNPCVRWLRAQAHGKGDITFLVHQTFVDKECLHIPNVDSPNELTEQHQKWAEHVIFLYLERGGLTATIVAELSDDASSSSLFSRFKKKPKNSRTERASFPVMALANAAAELHPDGTESANFQAKAHQSAPNLRFGKKKLFGKKGK